MAISKRYKQILALALPIIGGMTSQNILNLVDTAMVGTLGDNALAGVGMGSFANFMAVAFITGLSSGVQAMAARRYGEERFSETAYALNGGLLLAFTIALPLSICLFLLAPSFFPYLVDAKDVVKEGVPYLQMRLIAMVGVGMNFAFRGYWNGVNLSGLYMRTLLFMHACNIFLNWVLIFGHLGAPKMGAMGAGLGTAISVYLGTGFYFFMGMRHARKGGFLKSIPDKTTMRSMLKLAIPSGIQQFFFAAGMTVFFWIVGQIGTRELAAANVLVNLLLVAILPGIGFGLAAASLVGQALGHKNPDDAKAWGWDVSKLAATVVTILMLPALFVPDLFLGVFLHNQETLAVARLPLQLVALGIGLDAVGMVLLNALLGAGASATVMKIAVSFQWFFFLPLAYIMGPYMGGGLFTVWALQIGYRGVQAGVFAMVWSKGKWASIEV